MVSLISVIIKLTTNNRMNSNREILLWKLKREKRRRSREGWPDSERPRWWVKGGEMLYW